MSNPLMQTIEALAKEKGIEADVVITAIEQNMVIHDTCSICTGRSSTNRFSSSAGAATSASGGKPSRASAISHENRVKNTKRKPRITAVRSFSGMVWSIP